MIQGKIMIAPDVAELVRKLPFKHQPHSNMPASWRAYPEQCLQHLEYGSARGDKEWFDLFKPSNADKVGYLFTKLESGHIVPPHKDHFNNFARFHKVEDLSTIKRRLVFIEDWKQGHYFEVSGESIVGWKAGEYVEWRESDEHLGGNFGVDPRYIVQITYTT